MSLQMTAFAKVPHLMQQLLSYQTGQTFKRKSKSHVAFRKNDLQPTSDCRGHQATPSLIF